MKDPATDSSRGSKVVRFLISRCPMCGAAKTRPSVTAYVYCDFCGVLADYDFKRACEQPAQLPGPAYEKLVAALHKETAQALDAGDRKRHLELQVRLFDAWVAACPGAVPPRVGDPEYRKAYVDHLAMGATVAAFDAQSLRLAEQMQQSTTGLAWKQGKGGTRVSDETFAKMLDAVMAMLEYSHSDAVQSQLPPHPDAASASLQMRMSNAMFVQGWLPYLSEAAAKQLVQRTGLAREYVEAQPAQGRSIACGHCKGALDVLPGARHAVCENCGHRLALEKQLACDGCSATLVVDDRARELQCPYCLRKIERVVVPWMDSVK